MAQELNRGRDRYVQVDNFEDYELTPCIAYEMAIRNQNVIDILVRLDKIKKMMSEDKYSYKSYMSAEEFIIDSEHNDEKLLKKEYAEYYKLILRKNASYKICIEEDYKKFIDSTLDICTEMNMMYLDILQKKLENDLIDNYLIYPEGYYRDIPGARFIYGEKITNSQKDLELSSTNKNENIIIHEAVYDEFIEVQGRYKSTEEYFINNIIPNFKRQVNDQNQVTIPINLSLPLNEISKYLKKVKKRVKIKSGMEVLENELDLADNISNLTYVNEKTGKVKTVDGTTGENSQRKFADMLFIYDMYKQGKKELRIRIEISEYHEREFDKTTDISDTTFRKYRDIAIDYIENERYLELIRGRKS